MDVSAWIAIAKEYGPMIAAFAAYAWWQARIVNKLLDRHEKAYSGEIDRMARHMDRLLNHVLGPQASSSNSPTIGDLRDAVERTGEFPSPSEKNNN